MPFKHTTRGEDRLIYLADSGLHAYNIWEPASGDQFARHMDAFADHGVDIYSQLTFAAGALKPGLFVPEHPDFAYWPNRKLQPLIDACVQPLEVMVKRAHERGMKFFCKLRLTDWHRLRNPEESGFIAHHPQFQNPDRKTRRTLDYRHPEVWDYHAGLVEELARRFDIDGITLNFTRGQAYFPKEANVDKAALLTGFMRLIRQVLDDKTSERGRRLELNAIVWPHLQQCANYGVDVATWIGEDLIDHLCPGNTAVSDPNMDHASFSTLCRGSKCRYFPMLQPVLWQSEGLHAIGPEHVRALARSMYEGGADGISVFNWQFFWDIRGGRGPSGVTHGPWSDCRVVSTSEIDFPLALVPLRQARDSQALDREPRKYCFRPMNIRDELSYTPFEDAYRVPIPRTVGARGAYTFRLPEDLATTGGASLAVRLLGLSPLAETGGPMAIGPHDDTSGPEPSWQWPDDFDVDINGITIPSPSIQKAWHRSGRAKHLGRPLAPYLSIWFDLTDPPAQRGRNELGITLTQLAPTDAGEVVIEEIDIAVLPPPTP